MRSLGLLVLPSVLLAQITSPPEFQSAVGFQASPAAAALDGTSHVAAERAQINLNLVTLLRAIPQAASGLPLIENRMLPQAEAHFRKNGPPEATAVVLFLTGQPEASADILCSIDHHRVLSLLGEIIDAAPGAAPRILRQIEKLAPGHPQPGEAEYYWARALLEQSPARPLEALPHLQRAAALEPQATRALLELGRLHAAQRRLPEAVRAFEQVLDRDPSVAVAHYRLATLLQSLGKVEKAAFHLHQYRRLKAAPASR